MCTILVDGHASRACLLFAVQLDVPRSSPWRASAARTTCTPAGVVQQAPRTPVRLLHARFLKSSYDLLTHEPDVATDDLPEELSGVLCRCTGYRNIIDAVDEVANATAPDCPGRATVPSAPWSDARRPVRAPPRPRSAAEVTVPGPHPDEIALPTGEPSIVVDVTSQLESAPDEVAGIFNDIRLLARCLPARS